jgi:type 1 glutamine amidotransferase
MIQATRLLLILFLVTCFSLVSQAESQTDGPKKVLFVGKQPDHPFGTHMYMHTCGMLAKCLEQNGNIQAVVSQGWPADESTLEGVSTIVVYTNPAAGFLLDAPHRDQVTKLLDNGVGLVTIHWASTVVEKNFERLGPKWISYLGGTWISNVGLHTGDSPLKQLTPDHPVCRGWQEYKIHDEYYLNPHITDQATPVLQVVANEKPVIVGWACERQNDGRSYATTLGHFYRNFQREPFRRMVVNAILWTAHADVPKDGAWVDLSEQDLALPPKPEKPKIEK